MSKFDDWLGNEPSWRTPDIFISKQLVDEEMLRVAMSLDENGDSNYTPSIFYSPFENIDELKCDSCDCFVGFYTYDTSESTGVSFTEFWMTSDEKMICTFCYENWLNSIP